MTFCTITEGLSDLNLPEKPLHLAIGMFDGLHLGHQAVIDAAIHGARRSGGLAGVLTFDPHPSRLFRPEKPTRLIMPRKIKEAMLQQMGVDLIIVQAFDQEFANILADQFLPSLCINLSRLQAVYVGENFRFGKGRKGTVVSLIDTAKPLGVSVYSAERIRENGEPISSTRIREELADGQIERVNALLGHTYRSQGSISPGRQLGRTIGFPTLNVPWSPELAPRFGVYAVQARKFGTAQWYDAVANYGVRPTVESAPIEPLLEVHLLGSCDWVAGDEIEALWLSFIRPEMRFDSLESLKVQIAKDRDAAAAFLTSEGRGHD